MDNKKKKMNADEAAKYYFDKEMALSEQSKVSNILLIILTLGFIFTFAVLFWVIPDNDFSADENRTLTTAPEFNKDNFLSGKFTSDFSDYMADQFPFRNFFVGLKAVGEVSQIKLQNNNVILGSDNYLIVRNDYPDEKVLDTNITSCINFYNACEKNGIECTFAFAGRKQDVLTDKMPSVLGSYYSDRIWNILDEECDGKISYLNLRNTLIEKENKGEEVYYRNDHHWTSLGAYYAYCEVINALGESPYDISDFEKEVATTDFYGTTWSSSGVKWVDGDEIDYYHFEGDNNFTMKIVDASKQFEGYEGCEYQTIDGIDYAVFDSYYVREFLNKKDKYASFIGGNFGYTEITKNSDEERETILVLKDSFSHSMVQFLAQHYNLIMVDLRYYQNSMLRLCQEKNISKVVFIYNMETLTEGSYLKVLNAGLN